MEGRRHDRRGIAGMGSGAPLVVGSLDMKRTCYLGAVGGLA